MTSAANVPASKVTGSNQPGATFAVRSTASQRLPPVVISRRIHAKCREPDVGYSDRLWPEWRLHEVLRSYGRRDPETPCHHPLSYHVAAVPRLNPPAKDHSRQSLPQWHSAYNRRLETVA